MKRFILAFPLFVVLLVGYWAWPLVGLRALAAALQARNAAALSEQVDFEYLRRYLAAQIISTYLRITGREGKFGPLRAWSRASELRLLILGSRRSSIQKIQLSCYEVAQYKPSWARFISRLENCRISP